MTPAGTISTLVNTAGKKGSSGNGGPAAAAELNTPFAVAVDPSTADLYIADTSNNKVRVVTRLRRPDHHRRWARRRPRPPHAAPAPAPLSAPARPIHPTHSHSHSRKRTLHDH